MKDRATEDTEDTEDCKKSRSLDYARDDGRDVILSERSESKDLLFQQSSASSVFSVVRGCCGA